MWFLFLIMFAALVIVFGIMALIIVWIGSKVFRSIERQDKISDIEYEAYEEIKKGIKKEKKE